MSARQRFAAAQQRAMLDARSKIHAQTDFTKDRSHVLQSIADKTYHPSKSAKESIKTALVATRSARLSGLADRHFRAPSAKLVEQARRTLDEISVFALDDDPQFVACQRILSAAATLNLTAKDSDAIDCAANLIQRHSYLAQHEAAATLARVLPRLYPPAPAGMSGRTAALAAASSDARGGAVGRFKAISPRLRQLAPEALVSESAAILATAARLNARDGDTFQAFTANVLEFHENASVADVCRCVASASRAAPTKAEAIELIAAVADHLVAGADHMRAGDAVRLFHAFSRNGAVTHRQLASVAADRVLDDLESLAPARAAELMHALRGCGYRHPSLWRRLCNRQLLAAGRMDAATLASTLEATAAPAKGETKESQQPGTTVDHDAELVAAVLERLLEMDASDVPLGPAVSVAKTLGVTQAELDYESDVAVGDRLLTIFAMHAVPTARDTDLVNAVIAVERKQWHRLARAASSLGVIANELSRRGGLPAENPETLAAVSRALENMVNDREANTVALRSALKALID
jgi:hypothetical protein